MIGKDFVYENWSLSDFNFIMATPENSDVSGMKRELYKGEMNASRKEVAHYGARYAEPVELYFLIVKDPCSSNSQTVSYEDMRYLQRWLTSRTLPAPLAIEFDDGMIIEYLGVFTDIVPYDFDGINGFNLTFTCNSPFAYKRRKYDVSSAGKKFICDTDENDYVYPLVRITNVSGSGTCRITNATDGNKSMTLNIDNSHTEYIIDCKLKRILRDGKPVAMKDIGWSVSSIIDFNNVNTGTFTSYWLRLLPGWNNLLFTGNAKCEVIFRAPIKLLGGCSDV